MLPAREPSEYVKNRPRREIARPSNALGHTTESLELTKCCDFMGPPGSGAPLSQPFQVEVAAEVSPPIVPVMVLCLSWKSVNQSCLVQYGFAGCSALVGMVSGYAHGQLVEHHTQGKLDLVASMAHKCVADVHCQQACRA